MSSTIRIQRRQLIREAEGYLDLAIAFDDRWPLDLENRVTLASRALTCLDRILDSSGKRAKINYLRGQALRIAERYDEAIDALSESRRLDCSNIHTHLALGWCFKRTGQIDLAIESLEEALEYDYDQAITHYNLACYWALVNRPSMAVLHLSLAFDLEESYRDLVAGEKDFDPIRNHPDFLAITSVEV